MKKAAYLGFALKPPNRPHGQEYATMIEDSDALNGLPLEDSSGLVSDTLGRILRDGAQRLLTQAIQAEVESYMESRSHLLDDAGRRLVVRNGHLPGRTIQTPLGDLAVRQPRVRDRRAPRLREPFNSVILPPYLRRSRSVEELIPWLYLKGVSTGDMSAALGTLLGPEAAGLSASTVTRLKAVWENDLRAWQCRSLEGKRYVYVWADGVYFNIRLEEERTKSMCILVLIGATAEGKKELLAVQEGYRENATCWRQVLLDLKHRGLQEAPQLAIGDGALGFWGAAAQAWPDAARQRCWFHKAGNVLSKMPKSLEDQANGVLRQIWMAPTRAEAQKALELFASTYDAKYPAAVECLTKDREALLSFYDFPAEHWKHIRTTNVIESMFATVRLRTHKTKGLGSRLACMTMVFKLAQAASRTWRKLDGPALMPRVIEGVKFIDGIQKEAA
jgi:putative transposase